MVSAADNLYTYVGKAIREARRGRGLAQTNLASVVGLTRTSISNIENGRQKILLHTFFEIARALDVDPLHLLPPHEPVTREVSTPKLPSDLPASDRAFIEAALGSKMRR